MTVTSEFHIAMPSLSALRVRLRSAFCVLRSTSPANYPQQFDLADRRSNIAPTGRAGRTSTFL